jgi:hypothetical protein
LLLVSYIFFGASTYSTQCLWISSFFLVTALFTVKLSILTFYWRIFSISERFRKACVFMAVVLTLWWLSAIIVSTNNILVLPHY